MELNAYTKTISDLFSVKKKYIVPRFQREFSWGREETNALWEDIIDNIKIEKGEFKLQEYFIGALVLIGEDKSFELSIVDGQQRLTTITILLCALIEVFKPIHEGSASSIYKNYIEGKDDSDNPYFKLVNETPKPFFQTTIQNYEKKNNNPTSDEERSLVDAYNDFLKKLEYKNIVEYFPEISTVEGEKSEKYRKALEAIRNQIANHLKVIYITVKEEEDAYTIFETLNARGMNLSAVDLIKNDIFRNLKQEHPDDEAKTKWKRMISALHSREGKINIDTFFRHFWLSNYGFTREDRIYRSFRKHQKSKRIDVPDFFNKLTISALQYIKIANPVIEDWKLQEEKDIYQSLLAYNIFNVTQVRTLILAILDLKDKKMLSLTETKKYLQILENFQFIFTAICSSRASGLEGKFSKTAREIRSSESKQEVLRELDELHQFLKQKVPPFSVFQDKLSKIQFTNSITKDKKIIQYFFKKYEKFLLQTSELELGNITIEHIKSQKTRSKCIGMLGNLLPLDQKLNNNLQDDRFAIKMQTYKRSKLDTVKEFCALYSHFTDWTEEDIEKRTNDLAKTAYEKVWVL